MTMTPDATLDRLETDLQFVAGCLREVLLELGETSLAGRVPWTPQSARDAGGGFDGRELQLSSIAFQLLNLVEEVAAEAAREEHEREGRPEPGTFLAELKSLRDSGVGAAMIAEALAQVEVEPVLTAHPTEAKRATVLEQHRHLQSLVARRASCSSTALRSLREEMKAALERLWRTGEIFIEKPDVTMELRWVRYYLREVFPDALRQLDARFEAGWREAFPSEETPSPARVTFGDWVGGDRDGHPLVTAEVTAYTLAKLRADAVGLISRELSALAAKVRLSRRVNSEPPQALADRVSALAAAVGPAAAEVRRWDGEEPWRQLVRLMRSSLPGGAAPAAAQYKRPTELLADLSLLESSLDAVGARRLGRADVAPVRRLVEAFGFHLAAVDVRQNSAFHDKAIEQLLAASGAADTAFGTWSEEKRLEFLCGELASPRPLAHVSTPLGAEARAVVDALRVLAAHLDTHGAGGLGSLVVSMTRQLSDLLAVYLLSREAGVVRQVDGALVSLLPVVPLFETVDDLQRAPGLVTAFLRHPMTRRSLARSGRPTLQVMVGYSDSNKDAGILASQWTLHRAQAAIAAAARSEGVAVRFFHGRGGTVSRGAGPTHRFLAALPHGSVHGGFRLTEQGETIAQKYATPSMAAHHLELLVAGVASTTARHLVAPERRTDLHVAIDQLARHSREAYRALLDAPGFLDYWSAATPIDVLESSRIGSRPARRTGRRSLEDLRAIPWVFSWIQSRHYVPGWYGVGAALERLAREEPDQFGHIEAAARSYPFLRYVLLNVEVSCASSDPEVMSLYASLVPDAKVREAFLTRIQGEHERTKAMLERLYGAPGLSRRPRMTRTLALRNAPLRSLHEHQVSLLARWRAAKAGGDSQAAEEVLQSLLLSVNAIASGLRTTG
jgi:phosphoenolpyruvate carboxylase